VNIKGREVFLQNHLEKLRYFYETAKCGSMKRASEVVAITQPSLTKSIKVLEESLEQKLFIRNARGVSLTSHGEILFKFCGELFSSLESVERTLSHPNDPMAGSLRVGTYDSIGIYFWPRFLRSFLSKYPKFNLELSTGRSKDMQNMLENRELDLILIIEPQASLEIKTEIIREDSFKFFESTMKKKVYSSLEDAPLILMPDAIAGQQKLKDKLYSLGLGERKLYTSSSLESVKELAIHGIGIGLLPELVAKDFVQSKKLKEVSAKKMGVKDSVKSIGPHSLGFAYHNKLSDSPLIRAIINELSEDDYTS